MAGPFRETIERQLSQLEPISSWLHGRFSPKVRDAIVHVAANEEISDKVIDTTESRLRSMRRDLIRIYLISLLIIQIPIRTLAFVDRRDILSNDDWFGDGLSNISGIWIIGGSYFFVHLSKWRQKHRLGRAAADLIRALEHGFTVKDDVTDSQKREAYATSIQIAARTYRNAFKHSSGTGFFNSQVKAIAKVASIRIMGLIPGVVTADAADIDAINDDLTRLIIRSQTGYWHQTEDIERHGAPLARSAKVRLAIASFIKDRAIQVATISLLGILIGAFVTSVLPMLLKHK